MLRARPGRRARLRRDHRDAEGLRAARHGRRRVPDRQEVGDSSPRRRPSPKYAICNADESEPGTFKDRQILAEQPHLVLEGLLLGHARDRRRGGLGLHPPRVRPRGGGAARGDRARCATRGLLGDDVLGSGRRLQIEIFTSPGGYILGEESALLECMEGHRGEPRNKPPFPGALRPLGQADADELGRDVRRRPGDPRARRGLVEGPGHQRRDRAEVLRGVRRTSSGRASTACRWGPTARELIELAGGVRGRARARRRSSPAARRRTSSAREQPRRAAGLRSRCRRPARCSARARWWCMAEGTRPARGRDQRAALLPQRVLRQVRALPGRLDQGARDPHASSLAAGRAAPTTCRRADLAARGDAAA